MNETRYTLTEADLLAAFRLSNRALQFPRFALFCLVFPVLMALYLTTLELLTPVDASLAKVLIPSAIVLAATAIAAAIVWQFRMRVSARRVARQMLEGDVALRREQTLRWDAAHIEFSTENARSTEELRNFSSWLSNAGMFLLFRGQYTFQPIPARAFADQRMRDDLIRCLLAVGVKGRRMRG